MYGRIPPTWRSLLGRAAGPTGPALALGMSALLLAACDKGAQPGAAAPDGTTPAATAPAEKAPTTETAGAEAPFDVDATSLETVVAGPQRSDAHKARDAHRHPVETLEFFGIASDATVVELWPGGGWYTEILAPYLRDDGKLIVTNFDPAGDPEAFSTKLAKRLLDKFAAHPEVYDRVEIVVVDQDEAIELAAPGSVDAVLTFRNSHNWFRDGVEEKIYRAAFEALAPGGTFGVVQHRAPKGGDPAEWAPKGYVPQASIIALCKQVGFELAEQSEINANPKDTKDYEGGVWALPPRLGGDDTEAAAMRAIGESDRMTLRFVKPASAK